MTAVTVVTVEADIVVAKLLEATRFQEQTSVITAESQGTGRTSVLFETGGNFGFDSSVWHSLRLRCISRRAAAYPNHNPRLRRRFSLSEIFCASSVKEGAESGAMEGDKQICGIGSDCNLAHTIPFRFEMTCAKCFLVRA